jgi:hypothetical protein
MMQVCGIGPARNVNMKPIVAFVFAGIVGGAGGALLALVALRPQPFPDTPSRSRLPSLVAAASISTVLEPEGEGHPVRGEVPHGSVGMWYAGIPIGDEELIYRICLGRFPEPWFT